MIPQSTPSTPPPIARRGAVAVIERGERLLVIRRSSTVTAPLAYCFPGGGIEAGESEAVALVRELQEELGVDVLPRRCLWRSMTEWGTELAWWSAGLDAAAVVTPNSAEVESVHWLTLAEMASHAGLLSSNHAFLQALAEGQFSLDGQS